MLFAGFAFAALTAYVPSGLPANLEATRSIVHATHDRIELQLDVIRSRDFQSTKPAPAVIFLHGGAWRDGRRDAPNPVQFELARRGFICVQASYRFSQEALFPAQLHDARSAVRWTLANADAWGIDRNRIGIWGMSAGGHLALLTAYAPAAFPEPGLEPVRVQAVAAVMPTTDLLSIYRFRMNQKNVRADLVGPASPEAQLLGGNPEERVELARQASPVNWVSNDDPPTWLVHGVRDDTVPYQQSRTLASLLDRAKVRNNLVLLAGLGHEAKWEAFEDGVVSFFRRELGNPIR